MARIYPRNSVKVSFSKRVVQTTNGLMKKLRPVFMAKHHENFSFERIFNSFANVFYVLKTILSV